MEKSNFVTYLSTSRWGRPS